MLIERTKTERATGKMRSMLSNSVQREGPGLFVFDTCTQFIRTVPGVPRDQTDMDDVDTDTEGHVADEARYRRLTRKSVAVVEVGQWPGVGFIFDSVANWRQILIHHLT